MYSAGGGSRCSGRDCGSAAERAAGGAVVRVWYYVFTISRALRRIVTGPVRHTFSL